MGLTIIILYVVYSTLWTIGFDIYKHSRVSFGGIILAIFFGWAIMPTSYGTKRAKEVER